MKNNCNVARDLMPLVIDGVASEESRQYVDEHIAECTECAITYGEMRVELPRISAEQARAAMEKTAKKLRRKRILRGIAGVAAGILIFHAANLCVPRLLAWHDEKQLIEKYVCENGYLTLDALYYDVSQIPGDLRVQVDIFSFPGENARFKIERQNVAIDNNRGVCVQYHVVYAPADPDATAGGHYWSGRIEDGVWVQIADGLRDEEAKLVSLPVVRLELHAGDDIVVLWEPGDILQTPEEAGQKREMVALKYKQ